MIRKHLTRNFYLNYMSIASRHFSTVNNKQIVSHGNTNFNSVAIHNTGAYYSIVQYRAIPLPVEFAHSRFFSHSTNPTECWNCKVITKKLNHFICDECGKLQDITKEYDYFELMSLPRDFDVPSSKLTKIFRQLQTLVHPDKFGNKSEREQANSAEWSALINKAYKTLSQPLIRGQYMLKLRGEQMPQDNSTLNKEFLMEMMERNEKVEDAEKKEDLHQIHNNIQEEINAETGKLTELFRSSDLNGAKAVLVKMKYLLSIQDSIRTKLEKLNG